jgi:hypothetical protein
MVVKRIAMGKRLQFLFAMFSTSGKTRLPLAPYLFLIVGEVLIHGEILIEKVLKLS